MTNRPHVAYYRVSTAKQGASGLGLEAQRTAVAARFPGTPIAEFTEVESGKRNDRPKLAEAIALCKRRKAVLVIAKLDRLARNVHFISGLMESGVEFIACDNPEANRFTLHILAAVAENEARAISDRTKVALDAARKRGTKLGGTRHDLNNARSVLTERAEEFRSRIAPVIADVQTWSPNATLTDIAAALNARGLKTSRGCNWGPKQVARILEVA